MRKTLVATAKILLGSGIVIILLLKVNIATFTNTMINSDFWYFSFAFIILFVAMFAASLRWRTLLQRFDSVPGVMGLFNVFCLSYFYNFFIPGGFAGDIVRGYKCKIFFINGTQGLASVFMDRFVGLLSFTIFGIIGVIFTADILKQSALPILVLMAPIISFAGAIILFNRKFMSIFNIIFKLHPPTYKKLKQFYDYVYYYKDTKRIVFKALAISFFITFCDITSFYLLSRAVGSSIYFMYFLFFIPIITIVSYIPVSYSGLGMRELSFVLLFGLTGMTNDQSLAVPILYFSIMLILSLLAGSIFLISNKMNTC